MAARRLVDVCEAVVDCPHSTPVWTDSGVIVLRNQNIRGGRLDLTSPSYTDEKHFEERTRRITPQQNDVVITREAPMGEVCLIPADLRCCLGQRMVLLRAKASAMVPRYLLYALQSPAVQHEILVNEGTGSTVSNLRIPVLESLPIPCPPLPEQKCIAHILGTLDKKIELNRRMNATLEGISRALFKSWFVDFDPVRQKAAGKQPVGMDAQTAAMFPDSFVDSEIGEVPKGWKAGPLSRFFTIGLGGAWGDEGPSAKSSQAVRCLRGIDCHDLAEGLLPEVPSRWISPKQCNDRLLVDGTILVEGSGSFCGRSLCWRPEYETLVAPPVVYSNFCKRLVPQCSPSQAHVVWCHMRSAYASGEFATFRVGTAFPNFDMQGALDNFHVVVPPETLAERYAAVARQSQRLDLTRQSRTLAALRDTLLPKLLSGEIRVPEAEGMVEEAIG